MVIFSQGVSTPGPHGFSVPPVSLLPLNCCTPWAGAPRPACHWLSPTYRRHLRRKHGAGRYRRALRGAVAAETGKQMLELARIWMRPLDEAVPLVAEVTGWEHVEAARRPARASFS